MYETWDRPFRSTLNLFFRLREWCWKFQRSRYYSDYSPRNIMPHSRSIDHWNLLNCWVGSLNSSRTSWSIKAAWWLFLSPIRFRDRGQSHLLRCSKRTNSTWTARCWRLWHLPTSFVWKAPKQSLLELGSMVVATTDSSQRWGCHRCQKCRKIVEHPSQLWPSEV